MEGLVVQEVTDHIEDRTIEHQEAGLDGLVTQRLDQMAFNSTITVLL
jgi:hypothetical protein